MSVKKIADMLALAYDGFEKAKLTGDKDLKILSIQLLAKAMQEKSAVDFFSGLQLAMAEIEEKPYGNDPDIDNNGGGISNPEDVDENSPASSPAYEGVTDDEDSMQDEKNKPEEGAIKIVQRNFLRLRSV